MTDEQRIQIERDAIMAFAARVDARAGELIQAGRARNAHYHALKVELAAVEAELAPTSDGICGDVALPTV